MAYMSDKGLFDQLLLPRAKAFSRHDPQNNRAGVLLHELIPLHVLPPHHKRKLGTGDGSSIKHQSIRGASPNASEERSLDAAGTSLGAHDSDVPGLVTDERHSEVIQ